jgi:hypothetical protein
MFGANLMVFLILVPIAAYWLARRRFPKHVYRVVGIAFGAVFSPWAAGLYSLYFLSPWGLVPGMVGLALMLVHGVPGFELATYFGLIPPTVVSGLRSNVVIELLNGVVWAAIYGLLGFAVDRIRLKRAGRHQAS